MSSSSASHLIDLTNFQPHSRNFYGKKKKKAKDGILPYKTLIMGIISQELSELAEDIV